MAVLHLEPGDILRHIKRGSLYEVLGQGVINSMDQRDGRDVKRGLKSDDVTFCVRQEVSTRLPGGTIGIVYYRTLVTAPGVPWLFSRPVSEFTPDRFDKVTL